MRMLLNTCCSREVSSTCRPPPPLQYDGEAAVRSEVPSATIFRPAVLMGTEDKFFNTYAQLVKRLPFVPLIDGGHTRMQPVWVRNVADGKGRGVRETHVHACPRVRACNESAHTSACMHWGVCMHA